MNIVVTDEQYALLSEFASLEGARSIATVVRDLVDEVTPLLRVTVPAMRAAKQELDKSRESLRRPLADFLAAVEQLPLPEVPATPRRSAPQRRRSEDAPPKRRRAAPRKASSSDPQGQ